MVVSKMMMMKIAGNDLGPRKPRPPMVESRNAQGSLHPVPIPSVANYANSEGEGRV